MRETECLGALRKGSDGGGIYADFMVREDDSELHGGSFDRE
jgi:hypothetical protein